MMSKRRVSGATSRLGPIALIGITTVVPMGLAGCPCSCTQTTPSTPSTSTSSALAIVVADFNSDGAADLAVANGRSSSTEPSVRGVVSVVLQNRNSPGTFQSGLDTSLSVVPRRFATGDVDNANGADLIIAGSGSPQSNVEVLLQTSAGAQPLLLTAPATTGVGVGADVAIGDLNGDGVSDVVVADESAGGRLVALQASPAGGFLPATNLAIDARPSGIDVGDLDGDGRADVVAVGTASGGTSRLSLFFRAATSALQFQPRVDLPITPNPGSTPSGPIRVADLNGDGRLDLVVVDELAQGITLLLQSSVAAGTFAAPVFLTVGARPRALAIGDLNGDGRIDLATANHDASSVSVLLQNSGVAGAFSVPINYSVSAPPSDIGIGHLNGDGLPDIALAAGDRATVLMNVLAAPGTFATPVQVGR